MLIVICRLIFNTFNSPTSVLIDGQFDVSESYRHVERPLRTCSDNLVELSHDHNKIIMHLGMHSSFNTKMKRMLKSESSPKNSNATTKLPCRGLEQKTMLYSNP